MTTVKADLHNHLRTTSYWQDGDFNRAADIAQKRLGWGGIFGLVNFSDTRFETFYDLPGYERVLVGPHKNAIYIPEKAITVVKGQEVPTKQGHLLVSALPLNVHLRERRTIEDTIKEVRDYGGAIIADHPFHKHGIGPYLQANPSIIRGLDAIETFNGEAALPLPGFWNANSLAEKFWYTERTLSSNNLGRLSSSDGHSFGELGRSWTALELPDNPTDFNSAIFRSAVQHAPSHGTICDSESSRQNPQKIAALTHGAILFALGVAAKLPESVRRLMDVQKYYDVPRPENLQQ